MYTHGTDARWGSGAFHEDTTASEESYQKSHTRKLKLKAASSVVNSIIMTFQ